MVPDMIGYVYLMTNGANYKIGFTANKPEKRLKQLQTGNSSRIELVGYVVCKDMESLESDLHREFAFKRQMGEWFGLNDNDLYTIFERFKAESINKDMSLIPKIVKDVEKFMQIDGERLAIGKSLLHQNKYLQIKNYKDIVMGYMKKEQEILELKKKKRYEKLYKEEEEEDRLDDLIKEDAKRIVNSEEPIHTFDYAKIDNWKPLLDSYIENLKKRKKRAETMSAKVKKAEDERKARDEKRAKGFF